MNWNIAGVICHLCIAAWYYGRWAEKVNSLTDWRKEATEQLTDHETRISRLEGKDDFQR